MDAAKAYVKWLWIDNTKDQEDFNFSYGFHIPPRSAGGQGDKLKTGPAAEALKIFNENAVAGNPAGRRDEHRVRGRGDRDRP